MGYSRSTSVVFPERLRAFFRFAHACTFFPAQPFRPRDGHPGPDLRRPGPGQKGPAPRPCGSARRRGACVARFPRASRCGCPCLSAPRRECRQPGARRQGHGYPHGARLPHQAHDGVCGVRCPQAAPHHARPDLRRERKGLENAWLPHVHHPQDAGARRRPHQGHDRAIRQRRHHGPRRRPCRQRAGFRAEDERHRPHPGHDPHRLPQPRGPHRTRAHHHRA